MRRPTVPVVAALVVAIALTGCARQDPRAERINVVAAITDAANARNAGGVRSGADDLLQLISEQQAAGDIDAAEARRLTALATRLKTDADAIDQDKIDAAKQRQEDEQARLAEQRRQAEERRRLEEERRRLEEERRKAEEARKRSASPSPSPSPSPVVPDPDDVEEQGQGKEKKADGDDEGDSTA